MYVLKWWCMRVNVYVNTICFYSRNRGVFFLFYWWNRGSLFMDSRHFNFVNSFHACLASVCLRSINRFNSTPQYNFIINNFLAFSYLFFMCILRVQFRCIDSLSFALGSLKLFFYGIHPLNLNIYMYLYIYYEIVRSENYHYVIFMLLCKKNKKKNERNKKKTASMNTEMVLIYSGFRMRRPITAN